MNKELLKIRHEEITLYEAANRYGENIKGTWTLDTWAKGLDDEIRGVIFHVYKEKIDIDYIDLNPEGSRIEGYIFEKGINVSGNIYNEAGDFGIAFISLGDVSAKNIFLGGGDFYVDGNVDVKEIAGGRYDHGNMIIRGSFKCDTLIVDDYYISIGGNFYGKYPKQYYAYLEVNNQEYPMDNNQALEDLLIDEVLIKENGEVAILDYKIVNFLEEGKSILKER